MSTRTQVKVYLIVYQVLTFKPMSIWECWSWVSDQRRALKQRFFGGCVWKNEVFLSHGVDFFWCVSKVDPGKILRKAPHFLETMSFQQIGVWEPNGEGVEITSQLRSLGQEHLLNSHLWLSPLLIQAIMSHNPSHKLIELHISTTTNVLPEIFCSFC